MYYTKQNFFILEISNLKKRKVVDMDLIKAPLEVG